MLAPAIGAQEVREKMSKKHKSSAGELKTGTVKWFNDTKGFGFITSDDTDVFVHYSQINGSGHRTLEEGQQVQFEQKSGPKGSFAENVSILGA